MGSEFSEEDRIAFYQFTDIVQDQEAWDREHVLDDDYKEWDNPYYGFPQMVKFAFNPNESSRKRLEELKSNGVTYAFPALFKSQLVRKTKDGRHKKFVYEQEILDLLQVIDGNKDDNALLGFLNYDKIKTGKMRKQSEIWQQKRGCRALTLPILLKPIIRAQAMTWRLSTTRQPAKNGLTKVRRKNGYGYRCNAYKFIRRQNERILHCKCGKIVKACVGGKYKNQYRTACLCR